MPRSLLVNGLKLLVLIVAAAFLWQKGHQIIPTLSHEAELEALEGNETEVAVDIGTVAVGSVRQTVVLTGRVEPAPGPPAAGARVTPAAGNLVTSVLVGEGQTVAKDQPLLTLDARLADATIDRASQAVASDGQELARVKSAADVPLWRVAQLEAVQRVDAQALAFAQAQKQLLTVRSPLAGTVVNLTVRPGEFASTTTAVDLVDLGRLVLSFGVPPDRLAAMRVGQAVEISSTAAAASSLRSTVARVDPAIDPATGMGSLDVSLPPDSGLRPGDFASAVVTVAVHVPVLTVPVESLTRDSTGQTCVPVIVRHDRWAELIPVIVGLRDGDVAEVSGNGIKAGTEIAVTGVFAIGDKTAIKPNPVRR